MLTPKQQKICDKYSARDELGKVRCNECPLTICEKDYTCKAFMHYDRKLKKYVNDN